MEKKRNYKILWQMLCVCLLAVGVLFGGGREVKAGGNGVAVGVRLYCPYPEWTGIQLPLKQEGRAYISSDKVADFTVGTKEDPVGVHLYGKDIKWFNHETLPVGTTFTLNSLDIPEGYELISKLPMSLTYTQNDYDSIIKKINNGEQGLCQLYFEVHVWPEGKKLNLADAYIKNYERLHYNGKEQEFQGNLCYYDEMLVKGVDYITVCTNNIMPGTANVTFKGIGKFEGSELKETYEILPIFMYSDSKGVSVSEIPNQKYTGKAIKPKVTVKYQGKTLSLNKDYTLEYSNNVKVGSAAVNISFKGVYKGNIWKFFTITGKVTEKPLPEKNSTLVLGNARYKVTKSAKTGGTVTFVAPSSTKNKSFTIPSTVKVNGYTFKVTAIGGNSFKNNKSLTSVTVGKYVQTIGSNAFLGSSKLKTIKFTGTYLKKVYGNAFKGIYSKATIKVPSSKLTTYKKLLSGKGQAKTVKITK